MLFDVAIVGGGPAGLSAALVLGRARRRVLLCDAGPRRNAAAEHVQGFVTRDGTPPEDFRRIARQQLEPYPSVEVRDVGVEEIRGERGAFELRLESGQAEGRARLAAAGVGIDERRITQLSGGDEGLERVEFDDGGVVPLEVLFTRPPQRQVPLVESLGLALDSMGYLEVDDMHRETSVPGTYAAGDLVTPMQSAVLAAASGMRAAAMLNHELMAELATSGSLS